ncbi:DUF5085 family protein [Lentibacillus sp. Marseille-P4043]|uniref:DUF5085 family protein n=1 Tax=Lentibacillus sp. Marseille-P4043 TaxID=2040293 RepID=UPI000D0AEBB9|nr:DUF5085 family protein [Lentibacillus sp. Marseille-P4043]
MIVENHHIAHLNVVSKYYRFAPEEIDIAIKDFQSVLEKHGYHPDGRMLFSILSDPTSEIMNAEIFLPIKEDNVMIQEQEQINFRSYLSIKPMIMTRVMEDFDAQSQVRYWELIDYIRRNGMKQKTPVFAEFKNSHLGRDYVEMSVGV